MIFIYLIYLYWKYLIIKYKIFGFFRNLSEFFQNLFEKNNFISIIYTYCKKIMSEFENKLRDRIAEIKTLKKGETINNFPEKPEKTLTKKQKLVEDYIKVKREYLEKMKPKEFLEFDRELLDNPEKIRKRLYKIKNEKLENELAEMFAKVCNSVTEPQANAGAEALFQLSFVIAKSCEELSLLADNILERKIPKKNKTCSLEGLSEDLVRQEQFIKPVLAEIYSDYAEEIDQYMTSISKLMMISTQLVIGRLAKNNAEFKIEEKEKEK